MYIVEYLDEYNCLCQEQVDTFTEVQKVFEFVKNSDNFHSATYVQIEGEC